MRRREVLGGLAALGAAAVGGEVLHAPPSHAKSGEEPRTAWPEVGANDTRVEVVFRAKAVRREIALTFDDGPDPRWTPRVLAALEQHGAKATFFVVGMRAQRYPDLLRAVSAAGHTIGNHTYTHADLARLGHAAIAAEVERTSAVIATITGHRPRLMRPPWGHIDPVGLLATAEATMSVILWSQHIRASDAAADAALCLQDARPGSIVLAHDGGPTPNEALMRTLPTVMAALRARGYGLVSVPTLLAPV